VISAPPKFAWGINDVTTLYDVMEDIYHKEDPDSVPARIVFYRDIWPALKNACLTSWTNEKANQGHGALRKSFHVRIVATEM
jgi:hypothetical protein